MTHEIDQKLSRALDLHRAGNLDDAERIYISVTNLAPNNFDAWHLLGVVAMMRGDLKRSKTLILKAIKIKGDDASFYSNLGIVLKDLGDFSAALKAFDHALTLQPNYPEALSNRGLTLEGLGRREEALADYDRAIEIHPRYAAAHSNKGITLQALHRTEEALTSFKTAIACKPDFADAWNNYAALLRRMRKYEESLKIYANALKLDPRNYKGFQGRGELQAELGRYSEAFSDFDRALEINPHYPDPKWGKGFTYLAMGEFDKGWDLYDFRFEQSNKQAGVLNTTKPKWTAKDINRKLLIWSEQGIGDELFFARWLELSKKLAATITAAVDGRLIPAYLRTFDGIKFIDKATLIGSDLYDCHLSMGSLPRALRDIGIDWKETHEIPYLEPDDELVRGFRVKLGKSASRICGITWKSTRPELGADKSVSLLDLLPIFEQPDTVFVSLQYGDVSRDIAQLKTQTGIDLLSLSEVDNFKDLESHIALVAACDQLVLTCNATAHVAGALGKDVFLLTPRGKALIWYWANRADNISLWYPSISIYDQTESFSWRDAIEKVAQSIGGN